MTLYCGYGIKEAWRESCLPALIGHYVDPVSLPSLVSAHEALIFGLPSASFAVQRND